MLQRNIWRHKSFEKCIIIYKGCRFGDQVSCKDQTSTTLITSWTWHGLNRKHVELAATFPLSKCGFVVKWASGSDLAVSINTYILWLYANYCLHLNFFKNSYLDITKWVGLKITWCSVCKKFSSCSNYPFPFLGLRNHGFVKPNPQLDGQKFSGSHEDKKQEQTLQLWYATNGTPSK